VSSSPPAGAATRRVWSLPVRIAHWVLAGCVLGCLVQHHGGPWHERAGYVALAVALWRVMFGLVARDRFARFGEFVRGPRTTWAYAQALRRGREPHGLGHNPLGGWMIVALLAAAAVAGASGALYVTDRYWGDEAVIGVHAVAGWAFAVLVPLHVAGVAFTSWRERRNLVAAMWHGRKHAPAEDRPAAPG
jgi:cytochrome b